MRGLRLVFIIITSLTFTGTVQAGWQQNLHNLLEAKTTVEQEKYLKEVLRKSPDWREVVSILENIKFPIHGTRGLSVRKIMCTDDVERPWVLYIPQDYDASREIPLFVTLHGGVGRTTIADDPEQYAGEHEFLQLAEKYNWLMVFPFGQDGATWWDSVGMANIRNIIRTVKREFNVDDDRVWMGGFSDGGSGSFVHAAVDPSDYAAFLPLNGHMGVGSLDGNLPMYAPNFFNTPLYVVTTFNDRLYPSRKMRDTIKMAQQAGANIYYREHEGGHSMTYADVELPRFARFLNRNPRNPFPTTIVWETADRKYGHCRWFSIDRITTGDPAPWYNDHNTALVDDQIIIGFIPDYTFEGAGAKIDRVVEQDTLARRIKLQPGDIIVKANNQKIGSLDDLTEFKEGIKRGDKVQLTIMRGEEKLVLKDSIPEPENYFLFKREKPSAMAWVSACANQIQIQGSRLGAFRIFVHPDMFSPEQNLVIDVNDKIVYDAVVEPDLEFVLRNFLDNRDRKLIYVAELSVELGD